MCEAHSKVTHAKQQNVFITPKEMDVIRSSYYIHGPYIYMYILRPWRDNLSRELSHVDQIWLTDWFWPFTILQLVQFSIFLLICAWALQQCSADALPVKYILRFFLIMWHSENLLPFACCQHCIADDLSGEPYFDCNLYWVSCDVKTLICLLFSVIFSTVVITILVMSLISIVTCVFYLQCNGVDFCVVFSHFQCKKVQISFRPTVPSSCQWQDCHQL